MIILYHHFYTIGNQLGYRCPPPTNVCNARIYLPSTSTTVLSSVPSSLIMHFSSDDHKSVVMYKKLRQQIPVQKQDDYSCETNRKEHRGHHPTKSQEFTQNKRIKKCLQVVLPRTSGSTDRTNQVCNYPSKPIWKSIADQRKNLQAHRHLSGSGYQKLSEQKHPTNKTTNDPSKLTSKSTHPCLRANPTTTRHLQRSNVQTDMRSTSPHPGRLVMNTK